MIKSIIPFVGGATFGIISVLIVSSSSLFNDKDLTMPDGIDPISGSQQFNPDMQPELDSLAEGLSRLNATASRLENSIDMLAALARTGMAAPAYQPANAIESAVLENPTNNAGEPVGVQSQPPAIIVQSSPPTPAQIDLYHSIENRLYEASYNKTMNIAILVEEARDLTPAQRDELTRVAMELMNRSELSSDQLKPN